MSTQPKRLRKSAPPTGKVKRKQRRSSPISPLHRLLWGLIGLGLMVGGTLIGAHIAWPQSWDWQNWTVQSLRVNWQVGAVLLISCLGGTQASLLSQISYVILGLSGLSALAIFTDGGGLHYIQEPAFGYILGFIPGGWLCGQLAFRWRPVQLESLALSALAGLGVIHLCGLGYQIGLQTLKLFSQQVQLAEMGATLLQGIFRYSFALLPGQLALVCAVSVLAFILRRIMFY